MDTKSAVPMVPNLSQQGKDNEGITDSCSSDTETEAPLSQEGYNFMKTLQPNLSDEINSYIKQEYEPPELSTSPAEKKQRWDLACQIKTVSSTQSKRSFIQHVNAIPNEKLEIRGRYGYRIQFDIDDKSPAKSCKYTYSAILQKLFVQIDKSVPVTFLSDIALPAQDTEIRSYLVYKDIQSRECLVERCPHHLNMKEAFPHHVMDTMDGEHTVCPSTKRYVTVLKPGETHSKNDINTFIGNIRFRCTSACRGGISRRPILALFELYINKQFVGRAVLEVSICTSPGRDRFNKEKKKCMPTSTNPLPPQTATPCLQEAHSSKRLLTEHNDVKGVYFPNASENEGWLPIGADEYLIRVKGHENATIVRRMAEKLNQLEDMQNKHEYKKFLLTPGTYRTDHLPSDH